jgi:hypothetical protein
MSFLFLLPYHPFGSKQLINLPDIKKSGRFEFLPYVIPPFISATLKYNQKPAKKRRNA